MLPERLSPFCPARSNPTVNRIYSVEHILRGFSPDGVIFRPVASQRVFVGRGSIG